MGSGSEGTSGAGKIGTGGNAPTCFRRTGTSRAPCPWRSSAPVWTSAAAAASGEPADADLGEPRDPTMAFVVAATAERSDGGSGDAPGVASLGDGIGDNVGGVFGGAGAGKGAGKSTSSGGAAVGVVFSAGAGAGSMVTMAGAPTGAGTATASTGSSPTGSSCSWYGKVSFAERVPEPMSLPVFSWCFSRSMAPMRSFCSRSKPCARSDCTSSRILSTAFSRILLSSARPLKRDSSGVVSPKLVKAWTSSPSRPLVLSTSSRRLDSCA
mmetsp:Transcript_148273/g.412949  ORF Transcript_148273/g.412949 Transcript_148273/m.412949 type:complete len:268 (+) Transcript_148273:99-902(+)